MRELMEQGFAVTVVADGTAAAITDELGDGYAAAMTNFTFIANAVVTTKDAVKQMVDMKKEAAEAGAKK